MSATGTNSRPLPPGKNYHFHIIYNHEESPLSATDDNKKSLEYTELAASILASEGLDKSYYHDRDAIPGRNIFTELFRVIKESQFTLLIVTPGFIRNCWAKYASLSAFKKLLDKNQDHRLIALAFKLTDNEVPEELCQHEVLHFKDTEDDEVKWTRLKKVMVAGDVTIPEHRPIPESGDNRLHTDSNKLMAHPDGEPSLSLNSLNIDGDRQGNIASDGDNIRGANSSPGHAVLYQRIESIQVDGDDSVLGTADGQHGQSAPQGSGSGSNAERAAASGQNNGSPRPQQTNASAAGDGEPNTTERELMTKELLGQKPVTLDLRKSPSPTPAAGFSMSLEASPTVSAPVIAKTLLPPSGVGKTSTSSNRTDEEKTAKNDVHTEIGNAERLDNTCSSLTNDSDLTFDDGGTSQNVNDGATNQTEQKVLFNGNREETLGNPQLNIANTQSENRVTDNEGQAVSSSENADFQDLPLALLQAEMSPESGYNSNLNTPEVKEVIAAQSVEPVSSMHCPGNSGDKSDVVEEEISRDDSITELKQIATGSSTQAVQNTDIDRGELTTAYSDSSERPAPEGEDADAAFGDGASATGPSGKSSSEDKSAHSSSYNWSVFAAHCVSRAFTTTDSLFSYLGKHK